MNDECIEVVEPLATSPSQIRNAIGDVLLRLFRYRYLRAVLIDRSIRRHERGTRR